jgi:predicted RNA binding protein YcfA (HicA-like mRNA interferase family)
MPLTAEAKRLLAETIRGTLTGGGLRGPPGADRPGHSSRAMRGSGRGRGCSDANIPFDSLCGLLRQLGFDERIRGSHHIFAKESIAEILNLQAKGNKAKPYQVQQVRKLILKYRLAGDVQ